MLTATGNPVAACTRSGAAPASAPNTLGAMYQPVRGRRFTGIGLSLLGAAAAGALTARTRCGAGVAGAPNALGAMYQPVRVRRFTAIGLSQLSALPAGAFTVNGREQPAVPRTAG